MSEALPIVIVLSVMPVWFLKPSQLPAFAPPVAALAPVPSVACRRCRPSAVDPPPRRRTVPPSAPVLPPGTEPSGRPTGAVAGDHLAVGVDGVPLAWATVSGVELGAAGGQGEGEDGARDASAARAEAEHGPSTGLEHVSVLANDGARAEVTPATSGTALSWSG